MDEQTLKTWAERGRLGDDQAFRLLVEACQPMVYSLAFRMLCDREEARDCVQETFVRAWLHLDSYQADRKFSTWLLTISSRLCLDRLKKAGYRNGTCDEEELKRVASAEDPEQALIHADLGRVIRKLTEQLSPRQKLVFTLKDLEGLEVEEITAITGMSAGQIKSNLFLARKTMRNKLNKC